MKGDANAPRQRHCPTHTRAFAFGADASVGANIRETCFMKRVLPDVHLIVHHHEHQNVLRSQRKNIEVHFRSKGAAQLSGSGSLDRARPNVGKHGTTNARLGQLIRTPKLKREEIHAGHHVAHELHLAQ